jgi:hypothetical protein
MEIEVWIEFCNSSPERAQEFSEDAVRDLNELLLDMEDRESLDATQEEELRTIQIMLTGEKGPASPTYVQTAARLLPLDKELKKAIDLMSKFVHPSAMSLLLMVNQESQIVLRNRFAVSARECADRARIKLSSGYLASINKKYSEFVRRARERSAQSASRR